LYLPFSLLAGPRKELAQELFFAFTERRFSPGVRRLFNHFRLRWIGVDRTGDGAQPEPPFHGHGIFTDHIASVSGYNRGTDDLVSPFLDMDSCKTFIFSI
jgi:hypothetical protein